MTPVRRILLVLNGTTGGAGLSAAQLIERLPEDRFEISAVYPDSVPGVPPAAGRCVNVAALPMLSWQWYETESAYGNVRAWAGSMARFRRHVVVARQLARLCRAWRIDLIHTNSSTTLCSGLAARVARVPHVWHIRELIGAGRPFRFPPSDAAAARLFAGLSTAVVVNSKQTAAFFERHVPRAPVSIVPNGFVGPPEDLVARGRWLRRTLGIPDTATVIAKVASLDSLSKGHALFLGASIRAAKPRPDVWIVLFGAMPASDHVRRLCGIAAQSGMSDRIVFAGHVDDPWAAMSALDILGHGTPHESFGRVFVEAMLSGKPVVTPRGGGALSIVDDGETGLLTEPNADSLADAFEALLDEPERARAMGRSGAARAVSRFSMDVHVDAMTEIYERALAVDGTR